MFKKTDHGRLISCTAEMFPESPVDRELTGEAQAALSDGQETEPPRKIKHINNVFWFSLS